MPHISFSELKNWDFCPHYHKLVNLDKLKVFEGNHYTAFGTAMHTVCERSLLEKNINLNDVFEEAFLDELRKLPKTIIEGLSKKDIEDMRVQGKTLAPLAIPALEAYFGTDYEVLSTEEKLMELIKSYDPYKFKGFIDLVIRDSSGKVHIIDWKTCSWGWDSRRRSEPMTTYQLTLYKHYYAQKHNIKPDDIETHFALLKRTAKKDNVEFFRVTSGKKKTDNALNLLDNALHNITNGSHYKNRLSCRGRYGNCEFLNTHHCTR